MLPPYPIIPTPPNCKDNLGLPDKDKEESSISSSPSSLHEQVQPMALNLNRSYEDLKHPSYDGISEYSHSDMTDSSSDSEGDGHSRKRDRDSMSTESFYRCITLIRGSSLPLPILPQHRGSFYFRWWPWRQAAQSDDRRDEIARSLGQRLATGDLHHERRPGRRQRGGRLHVTLRANFPALQRPSQKQERNERQEQARKEREQRNQQLLEEREMKRQQAAIIKEQERERRRQHMALVKALEVRKRMEEREKKRLEQRAEKIASREKRIEQRKVEVELLRELRKPVEDMELRGRSQWRLWIFVVIHSNV
ncbi:unnamed protein product [Nesidiocoris tenuis]|uniref:Uncharacterized protein n=1 Tax=Nesidiocoris tenuis TaxID=355587 RepID=A0A6H5GS22_9HEMI|nr:unnamed protein product [Nesidiocoris tenuis]